MLTIAVLKCLCQYCSTGYSQYTKQHIRDIRCVHHVSICTFTYDSCTRHSDRMGSVWWFRTDHWPCGCYATLTPPHSPPSVVTRSWRSLSAPSLRPLIYSIHLPLHSSAITQQRQVNCCVCSILVDWLMIFDTVGVKGWTQRHFLLCPPLKSTLT